jgi:hypothetical protein
MLVKDELWKFVNSRKIKKMTLQQMQEFVSLIDSGLDAHGKAHPRIAAFNNAVKKAVRKGTVVPKRIEDILAAGRKFMKTRRFRLLAAGAIISSFLGEVVKQHVDLLDVVSKSGHYKRAMEALEAGDLARAHSLLVGDRDSLYLEILTRVGAQAALNFKTAMEKVFAAARDRNDK